MRCNLSDAFSFFPVSKKFKVSLFIILIVPTSSPSDQGVISDARVVVRGGVCGGGGAARAAGARAARGAVRARGARGGGLAGGQGAGAAQHRPGAGPAPRHHDPHQAQGNGIIHCWPWISLYKVEASLLRCIVSIYFSRSKVMLGRSGCHKKYMENNAER